MNFEIIHSDHGITDEQWTYIRTILADSALEGFFIKQVDLPENLGTVPCGIYGPSMGDDPVPRDEVEMVKRGGEDAQFRWLDPVVDRPNRPVSYLQVIGIGGDDNIKVFTAYGGPLAPQNPEDPNNPDVEGAKQFWGAHALVRPNV